jgi:hypothetical protein
MCPKDRRRFERGPRNHDGPSKVDWKRKKVETRCVILNLDILAQFLYYGF